MRFDHQPPQHPIAARHRRRLRRHRHQRIHEVRMHFAPQPGLHAAHGIAHDQAQVTDAEAFFDQPVLTFHHVGVIVLRKLHPQAVGRLRRSAMADRVGQNDEIFARVERRAGAEQFAGELRREQAFGGAAGAVQDHDRLARRLADGGVVQAQLRHHLAGVKFEIPRDPIGFLRCRIIGCLSDAAQQQQSRRPRQCKAA